MITEPSQNPSDIHPLSETMSLALDGLLDPQTQRQFERHMAMCDDCQQRWITWQRLAHLLQVEPFVGPTPGFELRVSQRLRMRQQRRERVLGGLVLLGGTLSVWTALLLGAGLLLILWLASSPGARVQGIELLAFAGQLLALTLRSFSDLRDGVLAIMPGPWLVLAIGCCVALLAAIWALLVPPRAQSLGFSDAGRRHVDSGEGG